MLLGTTGRPEVGPDDFFLCAFQLFAPGPLFAERLLSSLADWVTSEGGSTSRASSLEKLMAPIPVATIIEPGDGAREPFVAAGRAA
jgi:hypothetical protein